MNGGSSAADEQLAYYRAVTAEYEDHAVDAPGQEELLAAIDSFRPTGDVLELACGPGVWTERLERSAASVTALDGAPEMPARAQRRLRAGASVHVDASSSLSRLLAVSVPPRLVNAAKCPRGRRL
jgi:demethylmenaquinone methyltransferase/2-methoxy-6-polyprenyl-1,4-benzoquinol methylase